MKRLILISLTTLLLVVASTAMARSGSAALVAPGTGYDLTWDTIDGGGDASTGNGYALMGTIGQPDAGAAMNDNGFTLAGGFWIGGASQYHVYLPLVIK